MKDNKGQIKANFMQIRELTDEEWAYKLINRRYFKLLSYSGEDMRRFVNLVSEGAKAMRNGEITTKQ